MAPLTDDTPKALLSVAGKPLLLSAIESVTAIGVDEIVVVSGCRSEQLAAFVARRDFDVPVRVVHQERQLGLAHAISVAKPALNADIVVFCPDNLYSKSDDFKNARRHFDEQRPTVLQTATVVPSGNRDRTVYRSADYQTLAPNLFRLARPPTDTRAASGLPMFSLGVTFLAQAALERLPVFDERSTEHKFHDYLSQFMTGAGREFDLALIRGLRYDFTTPDDIAAYERLQQELARSSSRCGVCAILLDDSGEVLLQLRDLKPGVTYPGYWGLFGGTLEPGETGAEAVAREIQEEISYRLTHFGQLREFVFNGKRELAFVGLVQEELAKLVLTEGREKAFFKPSDLGRLQIRPDDRETLEIYLGPFR